VLNWWERTIETGVPMTEYAGPAAPSPSEERTMGTLAHAIPLVAMVVSAGILGFVASLVLYLVYKDRGPFARANVANSLNVQITTGIVLLVSIPLMLVLVGFLTWGIALVIAFVLHLLGALKAHRGEWWRPPLTLHLVH
jgi:uncharacterized Tic20 family protein